MENVPSRLSNGPETRVKSAKVFSVHSNLNPSSGTVIKLPSGKTAIAHGSGLEKLKIDIECSKKCKKSASTQHITKKASRPRKPAKYLTYTLSEILQMYESSLNS